MKLNLEDLVPETGEFELKNLPGEKIILRGFTLEDEIWLRRTYGKEIEAIFTEVRAIELCEIVYHQILDKTPFIKRDVTIVNDEGESSTVQLGGVKLLRGLISGRAELEAVLTALVATLGVSRPMIEDIANQMAEDQKKTPQIGEK